MPSLALGTVQFGMPYGVTNRQGQIRIEEAQRIVDLAVANDICMFDTAALYGEAEAVLGQCLGERKSRVISKTMPLSAPDTPHPMQTVVEGFERSLQLLGVDHLHGLMTHRVADLLGPHGDQLWSWMKTLQEGGRVRRLGASVYAPDEALDLLARYPIDLIQLPLNVFDRRALTSGALAALRGAGVEIHVRSAFLQGLLLTPTDRLPSSHSHAAPIFREYERFLEEHRLSRAEGALGFLRSLPEIDFIVVGVTSAAELGELIAAYRRADLPSDWPQFEMTESLIDPRLWPPQAK